MGKIVFGFAFLLLVSCRSDSSKEKTQDTFPKEENSATNDSLAKINWQDRSIHLVSKLPEVIRLSKEIDSLTKGKNHLTIYVSATPETTRLKYFWLKVGEDNGLNIVTHLNFYVDPMHEELLFYDVVKDSLLTLADWRKK